MKWSSHSMNPMNRRWQVIKRSVALQGNERLVISLYEKVHADQLGLKTLTCLGQREHLIFYLGHICAPFPSCCVKHRWLGTSHQSVTRRLLLSENPFWPWAQKRKCPMHFLSLCSHRTVSERKLSSWHNLTKSFCCKLSHTQFVLSSSHSCCVRSIICGENLLMYLTMPTNLSTSAASLVVGLFDCQSC